MHGYEKGFDDLFVITRGRSSFSRKNKKSRKRGDDFHRGDKRQEESVCRRHGKLSAKKKAVSSEPPQTSPLTWHFFDIAPFHPRRWQIDFKTLKIVGFFFFLPPLHPSSRRLVRMTRDLTCHTGVGGGRVGVGSLSGLPFGLNSLGE